jgi:hypothetical protein
VVTARMIGESLMTLKNSSTWGRGGSTLSVKGASAVVLGCVRCFGGCEELFAPERGRAPACESGVGSALVENVDGDRERL